MIVGVLGLQGDIREHAGALEACGAQVRVVRRKEEIESVDALILPGGESTTIAHLAEVFDIFDVITSRIQKGMPVYGSCAGMILLAERVIDSAPGQRTFGGLDITVRRNAFGRQVDSFEADLDVSGLGESMRAVFIRAPWVESTGEKVEVLASVLSPDGQRHAVAVRQGPLLATSFHPELTKDNRIHRYFLDEVCGRGK
jgi:5'-phosphate synthase pdxT subunit